MVRRFVSLFHVVSILSLLLLAVGCQTSGSDATPTAASKSTSGTTPAAGATTPASSSGAATGTVKIGVIGSWTGPLAPMGQPTKAGALMAAEDINAKGGFEVAGKKYKLELQVEDDETKAATAVGIVNRLMDQYNIKIMIGPMYSASTLAVQPVTEPKGVVHIVYSSAEQVLRPEVKNTFRIVTDAKQRSEYLAPFYKQMGIKTVAFIQENMATAQSMYDYQAPAFEKEGMKVVGREVFDTGTKDFFTILTKLKEKNPDVLFLASNPESSGLILKQRMEIGWPVQTIGEGNSPTGTAFFELSGAAVEGHIDIGSANLDLYEQLWKSNINLAEPELTRAFFKNFKPKYNQDPNVAVGRLYYDAVYMAVEAMKAAGSVDDSAKIRDALATGKVDFLGTSNRYKFDQNGRSLVGAAAVIQQYHKGGKADFIAIVEADGKGGWTNTPIPGAKIPQVADVRKANGY